MKLSIGRKLAIAFGLILVLMLVVGGVAISAVDQIRSTSQEAAQAQSIVTRLHSVAEFEMTKTVKAFRYLTTADQAEYLQAKLANSEQRIILDQLQVVFAKSDSTDLQNLVKAYDTFDGYVDSAVRVYELNPQQPNLAFANLGGANEYFDTNVEPASNKLEQAASLKANAAVASIDQTAALLRVAVISLTLLALVASVLAAYLIGSRISRAARHLSAAAAAISRGNLDVVIDVKTGDEMQDLAGAIERMRASLKAAIERLRVKRETA